MRVIEWVGGNSEQPCLLVCVKSADFGCQEKQRERLVNKVIAQGLNVSLVLRIARSWAGPEYGDRGVINLAYNEFHLPLLGAILDVIIAQFGLSEW